MSALRCVTRCQRHLQHQRHLHRAVASLPLSADRPVAPSLPTAPVSRWPLHPALSRPLHTTLTAAVRTTLTGQRQARQADPEFEIIYRFPYIAAVRVVCRLKLYQTGLTLAAAPAAALLLDASAAAKVGAVGLFAACMLYVMGEFFRRFVGLIYLHRDGKQLKIAHLTFWGGRRDIVLPVEDVVPFSELKDSPGDVYFKLRRYSSQETFFVSLRYGGVASRRKLEAVFGSIEDR